MSISLDEFWKLAIKAGLFASTEQQELVQAFDRIRGDQPADPKSLSKWLIERGMLSSYQAKLLLAGHSGPFHFGDYRVYDRVESGRLSGLFRAGHLHSGQPAVLFFFTKSVTQDAALWRQMQTQAQQAIEVKHPHVSRLDELVAVDGYKFAALENLDGVSLADYLRKKPLPIGHVLRYARKVAAGLARLHKLGQAHGDVRPENILLDSTGQLKLLFFPISHALTDAETARARRADFLAPELWDAGSPAATPHGDMYALGATIYLLITGRAPFAGLDPAGKSPRHAGEPPPELDAALKAPSGLSKLIGLMLSRDPQSRPRSMNQVADALEALAANKEPKNGAAEGPSNAVPTGVATGKPARAVVGAAAGAPIGTVAGSRPSSEVVTAVSVSPPQAVATGMPVGGAGPGVFATAPPLAMPAAVQQLPTVVSASLAPAPPAPFAPAGYPAPLATPTVMATPISVAAPVATAAAVNLVSPTAGAASISAEVLESFAPDPLAERSDRREPKTKRKSRDKGLNPTYVGLGVTAAVLIVGGAVAWKMSYAPAPTSVKDSADFARVQAEMRELEKAAGVTTKDKGAEKAVANSESNDEADPKKMKEKKTEAEPEAEENSGPLAVVKDDGRTLWASPTSGPPLDLHYVPPGTQIVIALRAADLLRSSEGEKILAALGPGGAAARQQLEQMIGLPLDEVEQLLVAFFSLEQGAPQVAVVARLEKPHNPAELLAAWNNPKKAGGRANYYKGAQWAYYLPAAGENKVFSVAPLKEMGEAGDLADDVPPLGKAMEKLLRQTDAARTFTLLFAPNYLESAGRPLAAGAMAPLVNLAEGFLGEGVGAAALSLNWDHDFFAELRVYSTDEAPDELARRLKDQIGQLSDQVENFVVLLSPGRYSARVLGRFPQMLRTASEFTRVDAEENQSLARCFLPLVAGHNLIMASELTLSQVGGGGGGGGAALASAGPKKPAGPAEALKQKITLSFSRDTLEKTIEMIAKEIDTEIVIVGGDLQLEGITKNQSFGLDERDKPAGEILRTVLLKANPDGKLVYVFKPKKPGENDILFVTTRASVAKNGYKLPPELVRDNGAGAKPNK